MALHKLLPVNSHAVLRHSFHEGSPRATLRTTGHSLAASSELGSTLLLATSIDEDVLTAELQDTQIPRVGRLTLTWQAEREVVDSQHGRVAGGVLRANEVVDIVGCLYSSVSEVRRFLKGDYQQTVADNDIEVALAAATGWIDRYTRTVWSPHWLSERLAWPFQLDRFDVLEVLVVQDADTGRDVEGVTFNSSTNRLSGSLPACVDVGYSYGPQFVPDDIQFVASMLGAHIVRTVYSSMPAQQRSIQNPDGLIQFHTGGSYMRPTGIGVVDAILTDRRKQQWVY